MFLLDKERDIEDLKPLCFLRDNKPFWILGIDYPYQIRFGKGQTKSGCYIRTTGSGRLTETETSGKYGDIGVYKYYRDTKRNRERYHLVSPKIGKFDGLVA